MIKHIHDCDTCVYLGSIQVSKLQGTGKSEQVDCYFCASTHKRLQTLIGRFGSDGPDYSSSHASFFTDVSGYSEIAERWYLYALMRATVLGLWKP